MNLSDIILAIVLACACMHTNAEQGHGPKGAGSNGHSALQMGRTNVSAYAASNAMQSRANGSNGNGSKYFEDGYQPWPQAEMMQFQKPHWTPYTGE